jgi:hypothetical protein
MVVGAYCHATATVAGPSPVRSRTVSRQPASSAAHGTALGVIDPSVVKVGDAANAARLANGDPNSA